MIRVTFDNETCTECKTLDEAMKEILDMVGEAYPIRVMDTRTGEIYGCGWDVTLTVVDQDEPDEIRCTGCRTWFEKGPVSGGMCPSCERNAARIRRAGVIEALERYRAALTSGPHDETEEKMLLDDFINDLGKVFRPPPAAVIVVCETAGCPRQGEIINEITFLTADDDFRAQTFVEAFGHGGEDETDYCPKCKQLGVAHMAVPPTTGFNQAAREKLETRFEPGD